jgi:hypothetical protein
MASRRMISSDIFEDDFYIGLNLFGRNLWMGLIVKCADDQGRMQDNAILIKSQVFPADEFNTEAVEAALDHFASANRILRYTSGNKRMIQLLNWWKHQTPQWASKSRYPAPDGWTDREKYHAPGNKIENHNWNHPGGFDVSNPLSNKVSNPLSNSPTSPINEGNGKGNDKGEGESDGETASAPDPFDAIRHTVESKGILLTGADDINTVIELVNLGATPEDVLAGIEWKAANNNGKAIRYMSSLVGPTKTAMAKRLQSGGGGPEKEFSTGEGGRVTL